MPCLAWGPLAVQVLAWDLALSKTGWLISVVVVLSEDAKHFVVVVGLVVGAGGGPRTSHAKMPSACPLRYIRGTCAPRPSAAFAARPPCRLRGPNVSRPMFLAGTTPCLASGVLPKPSSRFVVEQG